MHLLEGINITKNFGGLQALSNVDFYLNKGEIVGIMGPNGSGKTTLINLICGIYPVTEGKIIFEGRDLKKIKVHQRSIMGLARTYQIVKPFKNLSVRDNAMVGALFGRNSTNSISVAKEKAEGMLKFVGLIDKKDRVADSLTLVDKKKMDLTKALCMDPKVLFLDEVMSGLNPNEIEDFINLIFKITNKGITILVIEHIMQALMKISQRIIVLNCGVKIAEGKPQDVANNPLVIKLYLGEKYAETLGSNSSFPPSPKEELNL